MMMRRLPVALTLVNLGLLVFLLGRSGPPAAQGAPSVAPWAARSRSSTTRGECGPAS